MTTQPLLEISLHLVNGNTHRFVQNDPDLAHEILQQMTAKVFSHSTVIISGENMVSAYPGPALIGITILMDPLPEELRQLHHYSQTVEITEEQYQQKLWDDACLRSGRPIHLLNEIEFTSGARIWCERTAPQAVSGIEERKILHNVFAMPSLVSHRTGGISLWNRAQMVSCTFSPKPEAPTGSWPAERLTRGQHAFAGADRRFELVEI